MQRSSHALIDYTGNTHRMQAWTLEQLEYVSKHAHEGAVAIVKGLLTEFGIKRTETSVKRYANRNGISLRRWDFCPHCGRAVKVLNRKYGLCSLCSAKEQRENSRQAWLLACKNSQADEPAVKQLKRQANTYRQRKCRL